jgi:tRNA (cytidine/uridine-2'-O-)-methyltransferase
MRIALYQPDIPQNCGATMRLCSCLGLELDIIEPCGFLLDNRKLKRSGMDYIGNIKPVRHSSWNRFLDTYQGKARIILLTTKADMVYTRFKFERDDILLAGQESAGVPDHVLGDIDQALTIPMPGNGRSLNVVNALSMVAGEALRQTEGLVRDETAAKTRQ